jgi:regulator of RNase E activity RraA
VLDRLLDLEVSALSDADKALPLLDRAIRPIVPGLKLAGPAFTVDATGDLLPVLSALAEAAAGDVLVVATGGTELAVLGEIFTTEAQRRGLAGIVVDGFVRDLAGLRRIGLPVYARGAFPAAVPGVGRAPLNRPLHVGGVDVAPGDIVYGDDDGILVAARERIAAALETAEAIIAAERAVLGRLRTGEALHDLMNWAEHVAALDRGEDSRLAFDGD